MPDRGPEAFKAVAQVLYEAIGPTVHHWSVLPDADRALWLELAEVADRALDVDLPGDTPLKGLRKRDLRRLVRQLWTRQDGLISALNAEVVAGAKLAGELQQAQAAVHEISGTLGAIRLPSAEVASVVRMTLARLRRRIEDMAGAGARAHTELLIERSIRDARGHVS